MACRAALATLDIFENDQVLKKNEVLAQKISVAFDWTRQDARIEHVRQKGMIFAFDIKASALANGFAKAFFKEALSHEVLVRPIGSTIYIMPPYVLSDSELNHLSKGIQATLEQVLINHA